MNLRDLKTFLHLAESRHFGRSARAMHVSPSTLSRQIQRLEEDLGQPLFVRDNRTVTLTEAGEELRVFAQQTLLQYQQLRHTIDQQGPSLSGELHIFCSVTAAYSHLPPILDRFRAEHPSVEIKLTTGDAADAMEKVVTGEADLAIAGKPETLPGAVAFSMLENLAVVLIACTQPFVLYRKAGREALDPQRSKETHFKIDYNGLRVHQGRDKAVIRWKQIIKVGKVSDIYVLYLTKDRAYLFPQRVLEGGKKEQFLNLLREYVPAELRKGI